ncbi:hypothetical protein [Dactylosporangium darangshiense]|uniref:hypothetical protein n=1 Tax=Dactylosporangium darangshiense TaxID=579108 RepID=UPI0036453EBD
MSATGGSIDFQITVSGGKVVDGTVTQNTEVAGKVAGRPATGHIVAHGIPGAPATLSPSPGRRARSQ